MKLSQVGPVVLIALAILLGAAGTPQALTITDFSPPVGPGLGDVAVPQVQTLVETRLPNNDNSTGPSANEIRLPGVLSTKPFARPEPIDIVFALRESGGTTEYFFSETVTNDTGRPWGDFHFELGLGTLDDFVPFRDLVFIRPTILPDFDAPDRDPPPTSSVFARLAHRDDAIWWSGGTVPPGGTVDFTFSIDVPDDPLGSPNQFTLRQVPTLVPEPSALLLLIPGVFVLGAAARRWPAASSRRSIKPGA